MGRVLLTSATLKQRLDVALGRLEKGPYSNFLPLFETLYFHGFRVNELHSLQEWSLLPGDIVSIPTLKNGGNRLIPLVEFHPLVIQSIEDGVNHLFTSSYDTIERAFKWAIPVARLEVLSKSIGTHAFRHNRIKQLEIGGFDRASIKTMFGLQNLSTVDNYADSEIYEVTVP